MKCEQGSTWRFHLSDGRGEVRVRIAVVNGFHGGFSLLDPPIPQGGIDIEVIALEIDPLPTDLEADELERLDGTLNWAAAGMAVSCWRGLYEQSAEARQE